MKVKMFLGLSDREDGKTVVNMVRNVELPIILPGMAVRLDCAEDILSLVIIDDSTAARDFAFVWDVKTECLECDVYIEPTVDWLDCTLQTKIDAAIKSGWCKE